MFKITVQIAYTSNLPALTGLYATQKAENMHPEYREQSYKGLTTCTD